MSNELENVDDLDFQTDAVETLPIPHPWLSIFAGCTAFGFVMTAAVLSILQYVASRPYDFLSLSEQTARSVESFLTNHDIPPDLIAVSGPTLFQDPEAHYYLHEYSVRLPRNVEASALERMLNQKMMRDNLSVGDFIEDGVKIGVVVSFGRFAFANIRPLSTDAAPSYAALAPPSSKTSIPENSDLKLPSVLLLRINKAALPASPQSNEASEEARKTPIESPATTRPKSKVYRGWIPAGSKRSTLQTSTNEADDIELARIPSTRASNPAIMESNPPADPDSFAKLAIIVDDGDYGGSLTETILSLSPKLTLSILPYTPLGTQIAEIGHSKGFEIMLHIPMENIDSELKHPGRLNTGMSESEIFRMTNDALKQIPHAIGVNNHTGSKFTTDAKAMALFIDTIKDLNLYFIDSKTTPETRAFDVSRAFGVASAERDLFIDHDNAIKEIRRRFKEVIAIAKRNGQAIAICHFRPNTASVLGELLSTLEAEGSTLVHASELVQ